MDASLPLDLLYARYATAFLAVTLLSGVWLRTSFLAPAVLGDLALPHAIHAHSHLAFFGWTTMALFAFIVRRGAPELRSRWLRAHAHLTGAASAAVFVGFLLGGYNPLTILLSVVHVGMWIAFAVTAWEWVDRLGHPERSYFRGAVAFLVVAGVGAMLPGVVMARGIGDAWIGEMSIQAFLTPFTGGWLVLGAMGAVYGRIDSTRFAQPALAFTVIGLVPSSLLHTAVAPPFEWMTMVGRAGTAVVGLAALLFALDVARARGAAPLLALVAAAAGLKGVAEVVVAAGIGLEWIASRSLTIAYLHLLLLGIVTPALLVASLSVPRAPRRAATYAIGLALMLAALVVVGAGPLMTWLAVRGVTPFWLYAAALAGAAGCAAGGLMLAGATPRSRLGAQAFPAQRPTESLSP